MDETLLVAAMYRSRKAYETAVLIGVDPLAFPEAARCIVQSIGEQYGRDAELQHVDYDTLRTQVERRFGKGSMADSVMGFVDRFPENVSTVNVLEEYRLLRLSQCATELATLLATGQHGEETEQALAVYRTLIDSEEQAEVKERLTFDDFEEDSAQRLPIAPLSLNNYIGGGLLRGHNLTVYGRPESGKTLFALNLAAYALRAGYKVLYAANEEPAFDVTKRIISRLSNIQIDDLRDRDTLRGAFAMTKEPYGRFHLLHEAGASARTIRRQCARIRPDYVIVDQLKNLRCKDENRALQLDTIARQIREIGIEFECVTVSVTQAGESAEQKLVLSMTDVEWSNTGIPGAADLLMGIGVNEQVLHSGKRILSICKNKANSRHGSFPVWMDNTRTKVSAKAQT